ncbi:sensor histidine kinase [Gracilibacillus alcaliphilus]|uniref:sensor histidine kinase n=1 Tax=Gracilibacillus alcaliphilus TaxID=1401441 RepID=UPI001EF8C91A|nr:sensor histidine kinase [Gracilibacillus alcaliphilus]MBM7677059.1 two-component system sensor histidine kinase YesM [Gracilibacillus alcaliphilus]
MMKQLIHSFNDLRIRNKFLIVYFLSVFIPIVGSNLIFYHMSTERFLEQKRIDINLVVDQAQEEFARLTDQVMGLATSMYLDTSMYEFLDYHYESDIEYLETYNLLMRPLRGTFPLYNTVQDITFYTDNTSVIYTGGVQMLDDKQRQSDWYQRLTRNKEPFIQFDNSRIGDIHLALYHQMDYYGIYNQYEKIVRVNIDSLSVRQIFNKVTLQGDFYLLDETDHIIYSNDDEIDWKNELPLFQNVKISSDDIVVRRGLGDKYLNGWTIIAVVDSAVFTKEQIESSRHIIILSIINFILPTMLIVYISRSFNVRLNKILRHSKKIEKENFEEYPHIKSNDEIGQLAGQINRMTRRINVLFNEVYKTNLEKKDLALKEKQSQLSALQSQINPHFLFNALETIRMRSVIKGENETAKIIEDMAGIFRNALTWGKDWVEVKDEVHLIRAFLEIQKYRFGGKLIFDISVEEDVLDCKIPNLSILPFVENASIHGIEAIKGQGRITIGITSLSSFLEIVISDNGVGMSQTEVDHIMNKLETNHEIGESVGVQNVYYRLKLYYKDNFDFVIISTLGKGTMIKILLPMSKKRYDSKS